ncbi:caspase family protein [Microcoleus vaginatus]|uniref:caspase family protein n=1 Tax=Microcoleus vaginatus TaxID=119532 RepID=UPI0016882228|nr:caspase family protein [Microcoleus sp. FACHB-84]MBD2011679.1 caspase family protein [Microcoleus sp. FACHB-45]
MTEKFNQGYALLIGVGDSAYKPFSLPVTVKDTKAIYAALLDPELCAYPDDKEHIRVLNNEKATRDQILEGLKWLKEKAEIEPKATIFVYYSGHGWFNKDDNGFYLIQHDVKPHQLADTALSGKVFTEALQAIKVDRLLVVIDSCHAAGMATSKDPEEADAELLGDFKDFQRVAPSKGLIDALKQGKGRVVFTSSEGEQKSWIKKDNSLSIYTFHFLEALRGAANKPGDREVTVSNLMNHLGKTVPQTARDLYCAEQTPHFDFDTADFAIAKLRGGKGLPDGGWDEVKSEAQEKIRKIVKVVIKNIPGDNNNIVGQIDGQQQDFHFGDINQYVWKGEAPSNLVRTNQFAQLSDTEEKLRELMNEKIEEGLKELPKNVNKLINLNKKWQQEEVQHPDALNLSMYRGEIPDDCSILEIFKEAKTLLILGEPGAGKTTTMLGLAQALLKEKNSPIPVLLKLSSWKQEQKTMINWLAEAVSEEYRCAIDKEEVKDLLIKKKFLFMLDGLDDLPENQRINCLKAINQLLKPGEYFTENHNKTSRLKPGECFPGIHEKPSPWSPGCLVICSRLQEYKNLKIKLQLNRAICLQPLSDAQIQQYLLNQQRFNEFCEALNNQDREELQELLKRPLFFRIVCDILCDPQISIDAWNRLKNELNSLEHLLGYYIAGCLQKPNNKFSEEENILFLTWLAKKLQNHCQSEFSLESMQPSWLEPGTQKCYGLLVSLSIILIFLLLPVGHIYTYRNFNFLNFFGYGIFMIGSLLIAVAAGLQKEINIVESNIINAIFCYYLNLRQFRRTKLKLTILFYLSIVLAISNSLTFFF